MSFTLTSPVTGSAQTGLTTPTYTIAADVAPTSRGKQYAVTALGGTQAGVAAHSVASPFTTTFELPATLKGLGVVNPATGLLRAVPRNVYKYRTRKGVVPLTGQPASLMIIETTISVPAGADVADANSVKAALSMHLGGLTQASSGIGDTTLTAIL